MPNNINSMTKFTNYHIALLFREMIVVYPVNCAIAVTLIMILSRYYLIVAFQNEFSNDT